MKQPTTPKGWGKLIKASLTPELLRPQYRLQGKHKLYGHCYVASEALFHLLGGYDGDYMPCVVRHEGSTHWFLRNKNTGRRIDLTKAQFETPVPYSLAKGCGFLTRKASKRTQVVLARIETKLSN